MAVRPGGQALADGVFMRTPLAWAIARQDGSVESGPMPRNRAAKVPVARVMGGLGPALGVAVGKGMLGRGARGAGGRVRGLRGASANRRFLLLVVLVEAAVIWGAGRLDALHLSGTLGLVALVVPWVATLAVLRWVGPSSLWRYHGAEHKAASAIEAGVDLDDTAAVMRMSRVHNRCGTNLVVPLVAAAWAIESLPLLPQLAAFVLTLAAMAELVSLAAARPSLLASKVLLSGGRVLQRWVTTAEPTFAEQAVACRAMQACIAEHERIAALDAAPEPHPVPAVAGVAA